MGERLVLWRALLVLALLLVIYVSLKPASGVDTFAGADKVAHCLTYVCLYVLAWLAFPGTVLRWSIHLALLSFGVLLELLQAQTGYRFMEGADVLANITGTGLGNLILSFAINKSPEQIRSVAVTREK
jgi:VanZ family protein